MSAFADTSAIVKLYADEAEPFDDEDLRPLILSAIARVEVPAALWRKQRAGEFSAEGARVLTRAFESDYYGRPGGEPRFAAVGIGRDLLDHAATVVAVNGLRAYDGVQLACALAAREADPECDTFACFDGHLRAAAASSGFALVP